MDLPFIGSVMLFAGNFAPQGWAFCDGQLLSVAQNSALFAILGTTYGGNGRDSFALPDLRGRVPVHSGQGVGLSNYTLGESRGSETNTLFYGNMPAHTHPVSASMSANSGNATQSSATPNASVATPGTQDGRDFIPSFGFNTTKPDTPLNGLSITLGSAGGSQPVNNIQPSLGLNYIICLEGFIPSRG